ncbi:hypothetical protein PRIPAC_77529, partial [Pristionchus pacificus]|uniref:Uncharacterized protein n=1 Tax=Pristionchus pacificus TaxID=54126 RepID=A0A2A6CNQ8_PRIPA
MNKMFSHHKPQLNCTVCTNTCSSIRHLGESNRTYSGEFDEDDDVEFDSSNNEGIGLMMQMSYNHSIPVDALRECERQKCVSLDDICDHRPQCPGGEDETPVICFFHEMHSKELARLRKAAIAL